ncbi:MAG TPA: thermonuclease family protein [Syntrophorhabdaceae bacterium]|nr:thermonuclease family protein [Syntrophorhabdaceae bacterium]
MKRIFFWILTFFLFFSYSHLYAKEYVVTKVIDGDTIQLETGEIVRYIGIDAPELYVKNGGSEFYAKEAARYNKKLVFLKKVRLEFDVEKKDQHGRLLAYVFVKNTFVNGELVKLGYAKALIKPPNIKYKDMLLTYQKKAMDKERGLWQEKKKDTETTYIGNKRTYVLHRPTCPLAKKISEKNRIIFRNRMDAIRIGYSPCKQCKL